MAPPASRRLTRFPGRVVATGLGLVLALDGFVLYGARVAHPVDVARARSRFERYPTFAGLPGWDRALTGVRPDPGVYVYRTAGSARVNRLGINRRYPARTARIVRHGPGCQWREVVPLFVEHLETYSACATSGDVLDSGFGTRLTYFFVPGVTDNICVPPGGSRSLSRSFTCDDRRHNVHVEGTAVYLGDGEVEVDGVPTRCRRVTIRTVLTGTSRGGARRSLCTHPVTGLTLAEERDVSIVVRSAFIGTLSYLEHATFALESLRPA